MIKNVFGTKKDAFHWVDVVDPTGTELEKIANEYDLHNTSLNDCLDAKHLPKYEVLEHNIFIILRTYNEKAGPNARTVRELTRKIGIFIGKNYLITLHRVDQPFLVQIRDRWITTIKSDQESILPILLCRLVQDALKTYEPAITRAQEKLETFENQIFKIESNIIKEKYLYQRKLYVFKHMLKISTEIIAKLKIIAEYDSSLFQDLKETVDSLYFYTENIIENLNNLITLQLSYASHNTNEVLRILTVISVYFMPLMLLTSIYGMNFDYMPELRWKYTYPILIVTMIFICIGLYLVFKRKGWLK